MSVARGDDFFSSNNIVHEIWAAILAAKAVIADCTSRNANVFYEIGLCHAVGRETLLVTQNVEDIPFDLRHLQFIEYTNSNKSLAALGERLKYYLADYRARR